MIFALPFNTHQNAYTTEEAVNYQLDKLNQFVDISQALSAVIPSSKKNRHMDDVVEIELCMGQTAETSIYQG